MKPLTFISIVITLVIALIGAAILFFALRPSPIEQTPTPGGQYPSGYQNTVPVTGGGGTTQPVSSTTPSGTGGTGGQTLVSTNSGGQMVVRDFLQDPTVTKDEYNPGVYYLADEATAEENFVITYVQSDSSFTISIFGEPIGEQRLLAEKKLLDRLGITALEGCHLKHVVLVPASVNPLYAGKNLGFSFCPGATPL